MTQIIKFPKLKIGEKLTVEIDGHSFKCKIIRHVSKNNYEVLALNGPYKGKFAVLDIAFWGKD